MLITAPVTHTNIFPDLFASPDPEEQPDFPDPEEQPDFPDPEEQPDFGESEKDKK